MADQVLITRSVTIMGSFTEFLHNISEQSYSEFCEKYDAHVSLRQIVDGKFEIYFHTEYGYTQFILTYGDLV